MNSGNRLWMVGVILALATSSALAAPSDGPVVSWSQFGESTPRISEFQLFDGERNLGWARITRERPSTRRDGVACPSITISYSVMAGQQDTTFTITSALLNFPVIPNASVRFSGDAKVTDNDFSGATFTGLGDGGFAYEAAVNGIVASGGTTVAGGLPSPLFADDGEMANDKFDTGCFDVGDISSMNVRVRFMLSAGDSAQGSARFEVCCGNPIPLPTGGAMGLAGFMTLGAIRRRRA